MSSKIILFYLICLNSLFFVISIQKTIFDQTNLKHLKLKNRIFRGAVGDQSFINGKISEEGFKIYDQLSKNEIGTIFTGYTMVSDYLQNDNFHTFRFDKDEYIPEFKKLVDLVHKNGANIMMQLAHIGMNTVSKAETIYAPSSLPIPNQNRFSKEMTKEDIIRIENDFADAALRAKKAGFDGVEIHGAHFYLISEFLSPLSNRRTDEYGGSDENRARFLMEIIAKVREKVGKEYIVGLKINSEDGDKNGISEEGFMKTCQMAEAAGVDYIQISGIKWLKERVTNAIYAEAGIKLAEKLNIPVMIIGGVRNLNEINELLNKSKIQYFGIARPLICEIDLIKRWKNGDTKKSKCIACNTCLTKTWAQCIFNKNKCDIKTATTAHFQSIQIGEYKITYLPDGEFTAIPSLAFKGSTEEDWKNLKQYINKEGKVLMSVGSFLIEYHHEKILFDLGIGNNHISTPEGNGVGGGLLNNLKKAGVKPEDITKVVYSHFHRDHVGWTTIEKEEDGEVYDIELTFPNAIYYASKVEWVYWEDKTTDPVMSINLKTFKEPLEGKIYSLEDGEEIIPNLVAKFEFGHTPGLLNLILNVDGKRMWFMGDLVNSEVQFANPHWNYFSDNNEERAIQKRLKVFDELSKPNTILANTNFLEEAFGYLKKEGEGKYKFERYTK